MKKLLVYLTVLMIVLIIFPSIFTKKRSPKTVDNEQKVSEVQENTEEIFIWSGIWGNASKL